MLCRKTFESREAWLNGRGKSIGGSEASAVLGISPFSDNLRLWKLKTGREKDKDLSADENIQRGVRVEHGMRELFKARHPEYEMDYHAFDILYQDDRPWLTATLDGELKEIETGRMGIWECKSVRTQNKMSWKEWHNGHIPQYYMSQLIHQLLATGFDFAVISACQERLDGGCTISEYLVERKDHEEDMKYLLEQEEKFWNEYVLADKQPALLLPNL